MNLLRLALRFCAPPQNPHVLACTLLFFVGARLVLPTLVTIHEQFPLKNHL